MSLASLAALDAQIEELLKDEPPRERDARLKAVEARLTVLEGRVALALESFGQEAEARIAEAALAAASAVKRQLAPK